MGDITQILCQVEAGNATAGSLLLPLVYDELRKLAAARIQREMPGQTLQATGLVHEAYLRLVGTHSCSGWNGRSHFFAAAAEAMRRILVERARRRRSRKHGGGLTRVELNDEWECPVAVPVLDLIALDGALQELQRCAPRKAELVKLRFFVGLTNQDAAELLGISPTTASNDWEYARCWLRLKIAGRSRLDAARRLPDGQLREDRDAAVPSAPRH